MPKILLQDMVKVPKKRSQPIIEKKHKIEEQEEERTPDIKSPKKSKYRIYFVAFLSILVLLFALSFLFSEAKITLTPKIKEIPINENLSATKDSNDDSLSFDLAVISGEENKTIQGSEVKNVSVNAQGVAIIYNYFNSSPLVLPANTLLSGSNGKIYKTAKKVSVPGLRKDGKPGSVEVDIYAASAGIEYNSTPLDFKITKFKGTSKYSKIYARSKGDITGGFAGQSPVISDLDKAAAVNELKASLEDTLAKKITEQIPTGFILFKNATFIDVQDKDITYTPQENNMVSVDVKGTLYGLLLDQDKLTKKIAEDSIDKYNGEDVYIPNLQDLVFTLSNKDNISFSDVNNINFNLSGTPKIIWKVDQDKFIADLLSKKKSDFNQILSQYPSIDTAELVLRPFWKMDFPDDSKSIKVIVNYP
jgi:hypothetical protein